MYMDYYNVMSFRNCNLNGGIAGHKLNLNDKGIVINSNTSTSSYSLEVYGNAGAYIWGPFRVLSDITYRNSVSLNTTLAGYTANNTITTNNNNIINSINSLSGRIFTISDFVNTNRLKFLTPSGLIKILGTTSLSGLVYTNTLDITSLSGLINTANLNITSISGRLNTATNTSNIATNTSNIATNTANIATANANIATANTNIATANANIATANTNIATANTNITSISGRLNTLNGTVNTLNTTVAGHATSINTTNYAATYSTTSIIANGFVQATDFKLTNTSNLFYRVGPTAIVNLTSATVYTYKVSSLPIGLYIAHYQINLIKTNTVNGTYNIVQCRAKITNLSTTPTATVLYANSNITTHGVPRAGVQSYLGMMILNNTSVQNYQFHLIANFTGTLRISNTDSLATYLQFTKIG